MTRKGRAEEAILLIFLLPPFVSFVSFAVSCFWRRHGRTRLDTTGVQPLAALLGRLPGRPPADAPLLGLSRLGRARRAGRGRLPALPLWGRARGRHRPARLRRRLAAAPLDRAGLRHPGR